MADRKDEKKQGGGGDFSLAKKLLGGLGGPAKPAGGAGGAAPKEIVGKLVNAMKQWEATASGIEPERWDLLDDVRPLRLLKLGAEGEAVEVLQRTLARLGYACKVTSIFDDATDAAVRRFQEERDAREAGVVGPKTLAALDKALGLKPRFRGEEEYQPPPPTGLPTTGNAFLDAVAPGAVLGMRETGVPASVTMAQAVLESNWGNSPLARDFNNLFNARGEGPAGGAYVPASEAPNGEAGTFRRYNDIAESAADHGRIIAKTEKYAPLMTLRDRPERFATALGGIWSPNPQYGTTVTRIMRQFDLYRFDRM